MQLKHKKISGLLSAASLVLLNGTSEASEHILDVDTAVLFYTETDRVSAFEPVVSMSKDLSDDEILSLKLTLDSLTGASATGAVPSSNIQTFSRPSGRGSYDVIANQTPLDDTFKDDRTAINVSWDKPIDRFNRRTLSFALSDEYDFFSISGGALWQHEANQKNTTYSAGANIELDNITPVGNTPSGLTDITDRNRVSNSEDKQVIDLVFGLTQIIDNRSIIQFNLSLSQSDGYMTDPYKFVSVVDSLGEPTSTLYEHRPDKRNKQSFYTKYKRALSNDDIFSISYRYLDDDWGVTSSTFDMTYKYKMGNDFYIQPHVRLYQQSAADFYRYFLLDSEAIPEFASADYRLGEMKTTTFGLKFGRKIDSQQEWSARVEFYKQSGESHPNEAIGQLTQQDLFPDVDALIIQVNYSFKW